MTADWKKKKKESLVVLAFVIAEQTYALPLSAVVEVVPAVKITPIPGGPRFMEGVINFRGRLAAVLDMRRCLGFTESGISPFHHFIISKVGSRLIALHVDRADGIVTLKNETVEQAEQVSPKTAMISGVAKRPDGLIIIYDVNKILSRAEEEAMDIALDTAREGQEEVIA